MYFLIGLTELVLYISVPGRKAPRLHHHLLAFVHILQPAHLSLTGSPNSTQRTMPPQGAISEDERYRISTQYRLWSFTRPSLLSLRTTTNEVAAQNVREAVRRARETRAITSADVSEADTESSRPASAAPEGPADVEVDCLTVEEELKLVAFYCRQTIQLGDHLKLPTDVKVLYLIHPLGNICTSLVANFSIWRVGNSDPIHEALLHNQFPDDIRPRLHPKNRPLFCYKNRKSLLPPHQICRSNW